MVYLTTLTTVVLFFICLYKHNKYKKLYNETYISVRKGYILTTHDYTSRYPNKSGEVSIIQFVDELENYKNGKSKVKLIELEIRPLGDLYNNFDEYDRQYVMNRMKNTFVSIQDTNKITWLEKNDNQNEEK